MSLTDVITDEIMSYCLENHARLNRMREGKIEIYVERGRVEQIIIVENEIRDTLEHQNN